MNPAEVTAPATNPKSSKAVESIETYNPSKKDIRKWAQQIPQYFLHVGYWNYVKISFFLIFLNLEVLLKVQNQNDEK